MKTPYDRLVKIYTNCSGHMIKMAPTPLYGKKTKLLLWNQKANGHGSWCAVFFSGTKRPMVMGVGVQYWGCGPYQVCTKMNLGLELFNGKVKFDS